MKGGAKALEAERKAFILERMSALGGLALNTPCGLFLTPKDLTPVRIGIKGQSDTMAIFPPLKGHAYGMWVGVEVKRPGRYQSKPQKNFQRMCEQLKVPYIVARTADDVEAKLRAVGAIE